MAETTVLSTYTREHVIVALLMATFTSISKVETVSQRVSLSAGTSIGYAVASSSSWSEV